MMMMMMMMMMMLTLFITTQLGRELTRKTSEADKAVEYRNRNVQIVEEVHCAVLPLVLAPLFVDAGGDGRNHELSEPRLSLLNAANTVVLQAYAVLYLCIIPIRRACLAQTSSHRCHKNQVDWLM